MGENGFIFNLWTKYSAFFWIDKSYTWSKNRRRIDHKLVFYTDLSYGLTDSFNVKIYGKFTRLYSNIDRYFFDDIAFNYSRGVAGLNFFYVF